MVHGATRIVEKLLDLELGNIYSERRKYEAGNWQRSRLKENVANLEANINKPGVRQGNFQILTDEMGKPQPVSLNKDHAYTIISPPPAGKEKQYPHVLENVVAVREIRNNLHANVRKYICETEDILCEKSVVMKIWYSFYRMYKILRTEPQKTLKPGCPVGSRLGDDYFWEYDASILAKYTARMSILTVM